MPSEHPNRIYRQPVKKLVFVGAGHTHALILRELIRRPLAFGKPSSRDLILISPSDVSPYSGMLTGALLGQYGADDIYINVKRLCKGSHVMFRRDRATHIDPESQIVVLESGEQLEYDVLSLNCGAIPNIGIVGSEDWSDGVKPIDRFISKLSELETQTDSARIAIIGGGTTGCEVAASLAGRWRKLGNKYEISVFEESPVLGSRECPGLAKAFRRHLDRIGVKIYTDVAVRAVEPGRLVIKYKDVEESQEFDWIIRCTSPRTQEWLRSSGLQVDSQGFLLHDEHLLTSYKNVFAVGDMAIQASHPSPRAGVYAVRQAPILLHNLRHLLQLEFEPRVYRPQRSFLSLMIDGFGGAFARRGSWYLGRGKMQFWLKDRIDRAFMDQFKI